MPPIDGSPLLKSRVTAAARRADPGPHVLLPGRLHAPRAELRDRLAKGAASFWAAGDLFVELFDGVSRDTRLDLEFEVLHDLDARVARVAWEELLAFQDIDADIDPDPALCQIVAECAHVERDESFDPLCVGTFWSSMELAERLSATSSPVGSQATLDDELAETGDRVARRCGEPARSLLRYVAAETLLHHHHPKGCWTETADLADYDGAIGAWAATQHVDRDPAPCAANVAALACMEWLDRSDDDPGFIALSEAEDADELSRRLLASSWGSRSNAHYAEAVDLLGKVRGSDTLPDSFFALLLCTCHRWRRVTAKLIAAGHAMIVDDNTMAWTERRPEPPLRRWAAARALRNGPRRLDELLSMAETTSPRHRDTLLHGLLDTVDALEREDRGRVVQRALRDRPGAAVRARPAYKLEGPDAALRRASADADRTVRDWRPPATVIQPELLPTDAPATLRA